MAGAVFGRWWRVTLLVSAIAWPVLLIGTGAMSPGPALAGAAGFAVLNTGASDRRLPARPFHARRHGRAGGHDRLRSVVLPVPHRHQDRQAARGRLARPRPGRARQRPPRLPARP